jgi:hypothetical protein
MKIKGMHYDMYGKNPIDRFDLEQKIMEAWNISNDLKLLYKASERMDTDQMMSAIDGLQIFAEMRFHELWETFEKCIQNGVFNDHIQKPQEEEQTITLTDLDTGDQLHVPKEKVYTVNITDSDTDFILHENP